jgi:hypothetical protein
VAVVCSEDVPPIFIVVSQQAVTLGCALTFTVTLSFALHGPLLTVTV